MYVCITANMELNNRVHQKSAHLESHTYVCMYVDNAITLYELMHVHEYFVSKARGRHSNTCACPYMSVYMYIHMCVCMNVSVQDFGILFATVVLSIFVRESNTAAFTVAAYGTPKPKPNQCSLTNAH